MRITVVFVLSLLVLGCVGLDERENVTNVTDNVSLDNITNITQENVSEPEQWNRYSRQSFSFEYPVNMAVQESSGIFTGTHDLDGQTSEILVVVYLNTSAVYGVNKDSIFKDNPTKAASDFLLEDKEGDPAQLLSDAYEVGEISTYSISRDAYVAEVPFEIRFSDTGPSYTGHALNLYVPERSLHVRFRVVGLNSEVAEEIKERFLLSFRLE